MSRLVEYGLNNLDTRAVYFHDTTSLREGQIITFRAPGTANGYAPMPDNTSNYYNATGKADNIYRFGIAVCAIDTAKSTQRFLAGIVADESIGKSGPCWMDILVPRRGDLVKVEVEGTTDVNEFDTLVLTDAGATTGGFITQDIQSPGTTDGFVGITYARALEAYTTATTLAAKWVMWLA